MIDFWTTSGFSLLERAADGRLRVTDDYLRRYYLKPELAPVPESCVAERALHQSLLDDPRRSVGEADIAAIEDEDARDNYRVMLRFRDRLLAYDSLQSFYAALFREDIAVPPDFIHETVEAIVRGMLEGERDGLVARAAELFFREQRISIDRGSVMAADAQTIAMHSDTAGLGNIGRLLQEVRAPLRSVELEVLGEANHEAYWDRSDRHDTVLVLNPGQAGAAALARVIERWIAHFHGVGCTVTPIREIPDEEWVWHVGLDTEATAMLNAIYEGREVSAEDMKRIVGLFRADFEDPAVLRPEVAGAPVFMALAMRSDGSLRMKPQNLLVNLPLARRA
ncbi:MAG: DUF6352 family protein [Rhodospirillaceae bacterium]